MKRRGEGSRSMGSGNSTSTGKRLEGKVAIVTGGATGVGATTTRVLTQHGAKVIIADIQDIVGQSLADELNIEDDDGQYNHVSFHHCDVSDEEQVRALVDAAVAQHGKLDIFIYNNTNEAAEGGSILDSTCCLEDLHRVLGANLKGAFYGAKHAVRVMGPTNRGCILFTSASEDGALLGRHQEVMCKYGIMGLLKNLSAEVGNKGIRVNCVSSSSSHPSLDSIARGVLYLATDDSNYVSGHNLVLHGPTIPHPP